MARTIKSLLGEMEKGPSKPLFVELEEFCTRKGLDVIDTFFGDDTPPRVIKLWEADTDFNAWLEQRFKQQAAQAIGHASSRRWFYKDQPRDELVRQAVEVVEGNFISWRDSSGGVNASYQDYRIVDPEAKIVEPLIAGEDRYRDISRALAPIIARDGYRISQSEARLIWDFASVHGSLINAKPQICAQPEERDWCLHRISVVPDASVPFPTTQAFLDRINDAEAFAAWLYGVASGRYRGRQIMWLQGKGSDGKSTFFKAFASLFGAASGSVDWNQLKSNPGFAGSLFVNKRFVYVPDCNNTELLNTGLFKSLSDPDSDPVTINHKYGKMYATELEAHTAVLSNYAPAIRNETHSLTRAMLLTISPRDLSIPADKSITDKFKAELPGFLAYGRDCYERVCANNTEIRLNEAAQSKIEERIEATVERWTVILNEHFVLDPDANTLSSTVYKVLKEDRRLTDFEVGEFRDWLASQYGVEWKQMGDGSGKRPRHYCGLRLRTASDRASNIIAMKTRANIHQDEVA